MCVRRLVVVVIVTDHPERCQVYPLYNAYPTEVEITEVAGSRIPSFSFTITKG